MGFNLLFLNLLHKISLKDVLSKDKLFTDYSERLSLEQRIVFDGAGAVTAVAADVADNDDSSQSNEDSTNAHLPAALSDQDLQAQPSEIVFIDMSVPDAEVLAQNVNDSALVVYIDSAKDGFTQVESVLSAYSSIDSVHIISHGDNDGFYLGSSLVTADTIDDNADNFSGWRSYLSNDADILFYGCNLAENTDGQSLLSQIGDLTGADIAASDDLTGAAALGGDWDLEFSDGDIESALIISALGQAEYAHILPAMPSVAVSDPPPPLLGEQVTHTISFDNTSAVDSGFAPFVDLYIPFLGSDGVYDAATDTYTDSADGMSFDSAKYLGQDVTATIITIEDIDGGTGGIQFEHPALKDATGNPLIVTAPAGFSEGDQFVLLELPFGSFSPDQPVADIDVTFNVSTDADVGVGMDFASRGGFLLGNDAEDNPDVDAPITTAF